MAQEYLGITPENALGCQADAVFAGGALHESDRLPGFVDVAAFEAERRSIRFTLEVEVSMGDVDHGSFSGIEWGIFARAGSRICRGRDRRQIPSPRAEGRGLAAGNLSAEMI